MAYPKILQRLFEDFGAGPKLRGDILPFGSKEGTACEGDDARLSNARVPETHNETHKTGGTDPLTPADIGAHPADGMASTDKAGIVRLSSATDMDSEDQASTPKAVKAAYELADTAKSMAAEAQGKADAAYEKAMLDATTDVAGRTQLSSEVDSDREDMAATPRAVKSVHDKAIEAASAASAAQALAASAESTATAAKTNADKVPEISTQVKALEDKVQTATPDDLGMVRIGQGISVDETGLISTEPVTLATPDAPGIVQVGAGLEVTLPTEAAEGEEAPTPGVLSLGAHASKSAGQYGQGSSAFYGHVKVTDNWKEDIPADSGIAISPKGVRDAIADAGGDIGDITPDWSADGNDALGTIQADGSLLITKSGTFTVPATGSYSVSVVSGGGNGGAGSYYYRARKGGGGGGGGAGQYVAATLSLEKGNAIPVIVGGSQGVTTFLSLTGNPGGAGGSAPNTTSAGGMGISYGTGGSSGRVGKGNDIASMSGGAGASSLFPYSSSVKLAGNGQQGHPDDEMGNGYGYGGAGGAGYGAGGGGGGASSNTGVAGGGAGAQGAIWIKRIS